jgi:hypothetical protein
MQQIQRDHTTVDVTIANGASLSQAIDFRQFSLMTVRMPATWTAASIGFKVSDTAGGTFSPLYDDGGSLVQISSPTANNAYVAPAEVAAGHWVKLWSQNGSGSDTNQAAARTLAVDLKG